MDQIRHEYDWQQVRKWTNIQYSHHHPFIEVALAAMDATVNCHLTLRETMLQVHLLLRQHWMSCWRPVNEIKKDLKKCSLLWQKSKNLFIKVYFQCQSDSVRELGRVSGKEIHGPNWKPSKLQDTRNISKISIAKKFQYAWGQRRELGLKVV